MCWDSGIHAACVEMTRVCIVAHPSTVVLPARGSASCSCPAALPMATRLLPAGALNIRTPPGKSAYSVEAAVDIAVAASWPCDDCDFFLDSIGTGLSKMAWTARQVLFMTDQNAYRLRVNLCLLSQAYVQATTVLAQGYKAGACDQWLVSMACMEHHRAVLSRTYRGKLSSGGRMCRSSAAGVGIKWLKKLTVVASRCPSRS